MVLGGGYTVYTTQYNYKLLILLTLIDEYVVR